MKSYIYTIDDEYLGITLTIEAELVDYEDHDGTLKILNESAPIPIEHISWDCLSIEAQGYGVIQKVGPLKVVPKQTKRDFYEGFLAAYAKYRQKERRKHERFAKRFITDLDSINW